MKKITIGISEGKVIYKDSSGKGKSIQVDSVVIHAGLKAKRMMHRHPTAQHPGSL